MINLDKQLRDLIFPLIKYFCGENTPQEAIDQIVNQDIYKIKQIFEGAGWEQINPSNPVKHTPIMMTGEEFYNRFNQVVEMDINHEKSGGHVLRYQDTTENFLKAARKAAGIDNEK